MSCVNDVTLTSFSGHTATVGASSADDWHSLGDIDDYLGSSSHQATGGCPMTITLYDVAATVDAPTFVTANEATADTKLNINIVDNDLQVN